MIHDNPLRSFFCNPYKLLKTAGLKQGQKVLEAGCPSGILYDSCGKNMHVIYIPHLSKSQEEKMSEKLRLKGGYKRT